MTLRPANLTIVTTAAALLVALLIVSCSASDTMWGGACASSTSSVSSCIDCCQERKCKSRCLDKCKDKAKSTANAKEDWCDSYYGASSSYYGWYDDEKDLYGNDDCSSDNRCGRCEGDCDKDSHCKDNLKCFQRDGKEDVPGCSGSGRSGWD